MGIIRDAIFLWLVHSMDTLGLKISLRNAVGVVPQVDFIFEWFSFYNYILVGSVKKSWSASLRGEGRSVFKCGIFCDVNFFLRLCSVHNF